jgi:hypothetical protein
MSDQATQVTPDTSANPAPAPQGLATPTPAPSAPASAPNQEPVSGLDFIPEAYRQDPSFAKYKTQDDFFKGFQNLQKLVGQKQIVEGLKLPEENASEQELNDFYNKLGRPESADKYELPSDLQVPEGYNLDEVSQNFKSIAHKNGIPQKQAAALFKDFIEVEKQNFIKSQEQVKLSFDKAVIEAFGNEYKNDLGSAKKAAKALGIADKLDSEGLSANPTVLKVLAKLGEHYGEDSFEDGTSGSKETLLDEAERLQKSDLYQKGDKETHRKVEEIYQKVYG